MKKSPKLTKTSILKIALIFVKPKLKYILEDILEIM